MVRIYWLSFVIRTGNLLTFIVFARNKALRNTTNVFLASLTASDAIVAVVSLPVTFAVFFCDALPNSHTANMVYRYVYTYTMNLKIQQFITTIVFTMSSFYFMTNLFRRISEKKKIR